MEQSPYLGTEMRPEYVPTSDEKTMAILAHVLTIVAPVLAPLIIYLVKKDESKYISYHAKESLNFQITMTIVALILIVSIIGLFFVWIVGILALVFVVIASIKASEGKLYKYPFTLRLIK
jgi:uncharacterized Tic20 family protein